MSDLNNGKNVRIDGADTADVLVSTKLIIRERKLDVRNVLSAYIYIPCVYTLLRARACTYAHSAGDTPLRVAPRRSAPGVYIYIPTYWGLRFGGTPSTRLDLRLFNSSACQKHQCTLCSLIVLFPFLSFSVFRPLPFDPFPLVLSFTPSLRSFFFSLSNIPPFGPPPFSPLLPI